MNHTKFLARKQSGFTLVEIAIVLVIIGLLLGGVLKGQEMIENARIKSVVADMNGISAAYNSYIDRYRAIPGDEVAATLTGRGWTGAAAGNGNGVLGTLPAATFTNAAAEQGAMWRSLRASGLTSGDPAAAVGVAGLPRAGTGGLLGVSVGAYGLVGPTVCVSGLTTKQAAGIDSTVDGAVVAPSFGNAVGNLRAATGAAVPLVPTAVAPAGTAYNETLATLWTSCRAL
ncbi:MAG: prepilin-type N-terminal cleavage/methylation domain-containing protein [Pseudomonadota bacterium]